MRQTSTFTLPSPWPLQLLLWIAAFALAFCIHATTADAGQLPTNRSSQPSIRRLRIVNRASVKVARAHGRAIAGFPARQTVKNLSGAVLHVAKSVDNVTAYYRPGRIIGDIIFTPFRH